MDVILVVLERPGTAEALLTAALNLGETLGGARVQALAINATIESAITVAEGILTEESARLLAATDRARMGELRAALDRIADSAPGQVLHWVEDEGTVEVVVEERGSRADLVVVARPDQDDDRLARTAFRAALFETGRPVLVVPPMVWPIAQRPIGRRIAIAWRDDRRTEKAVLAAHRLLSRAEEVHVLAGVRADASSPGMPSILREHGIAARLHALPIGTGVFGQTLLDRAHAIEADMLLMGAYVHNPIRRLLLGGVTRFVLDNADIPILMSY
jgi:nucleotide-binding universal stress UspA family protein